MVIVPAKVTDVRMEIVHPKAEDNRRATAIVVLMRDAPMETSRAMASLAETGTVLATVNADRKRIGLATVNVSLNHARKVARRVAKKRKTSLATKRSPDDQNGTIATKNLPDTARRSMDDRRAVLFVPDAAVCSCGT